MSGRHPRWIAAAATVAALGIVLSVTARAQFGVVSSPVAWAPGAERQVGPIRIVPIRRNIFMLASDDGNSTVQVGSHGVVVVDTMSTAMAPALLEAIRTISTSPVVQIINTSVDGTGGNDVLRRAGRNATAGGGGATILAFETVLARMKADTSSTLLPTDTFFVESKDLHLNGEGIFVYHHPAAYSDGDLAVLFRGSDVVSTGALFAQDRYPRIDLAKGSSITGLITSVNRILDLMVPELKEEGGTMAVPAFGRLSDQADVAEYRDMLTIVRDRVEGLLSRPMTLEQVLAAKPTRDYDPIYGTAQSSGDMFVEGVYRSLTQAQKRAGE